MGITCSIGAAVFLVASVALAICFTPALALLAMFIRWVQRAPPNLSAPA
jgi:hypothetical protein